MKRLLIIQTLFIASLCSCITPQLWAQMSAGGTPISFGQNFKQSTAAAITLPTVKLPAVDAARLKKNVSQGNRFAAAIPVSFDLNNSGTWVDLANGDRLWRLKLNSPGALSLRVFFKDFDIPRGSKLYVYDEDKQRILGAFTQANKPTSGRLGTDIIRHHTITIEYYEPKRVAKLGQFRIWRVDHGFRAIDVDSELKRLKTGNTANDFGTSGACNVNVACAGTEWEDASKGIVLMVLNDADGSGFCTGSLVNNTQRDETPYILSAFHCLGEAGQSFVDTWVFVLGYASNACDNPLEEPSRDLSLSDAQIVARYDSSDFLLLRLNQPIPENYEVYYNGWERSGIAPENSTCIHHPSGDIKKISFDRDLPRSNPAAENLEGQIMPAGAGWLTVWEEGTTEGGSSGSPLLDNESQRIIGQLFGGNASCRFTEGEDIYGKMSESWLGGGTPETSLAPWLDPLGTGINGLDGWDGEQLANDLVIYEIRLEQNACDFSSSSPLRVNVFNGGSNAANNVDISYTLSRSDGSIVRQESRNLSTLASSAFLEETFNLDLSQPGDTFNLSVQVSSLGLSDDQPDDNEQVLKIIIPAQIDELPYAESFESNTGGWTSNGSNNTWAIGMPNTTIINQAGEGSNAWVTSLAGNYENNEVSFITSPVIDLTSFNNPIFRANLILDTEVDFDGLQLQISTDCGETWSQLGDIGIGTNWYNNVSVEFQGNNPASWSGSIGNDWQEIAYSLFDFRDQSQVRLRFAFLSDFSRTQEGAAVDNIRITNSATILRINFEGDLNFGEIPDDRSSTRFFTIINEGNTTLKIDSITLANGFTSDFVNGEIPAGARQSISVSIDPQPNTSYEGSVIIYSNANSGRNRLAISAVSIDVNNIPTALISPLNEKTKVFPNPSQGQLQIELPGDFPIASVLAAQVYNYAGVLVSQTDLRIEQINNQPTARLALEGLAKGIYLLKIQVPDGLIIQRIVLE